jgi:hypothetical protein
MQSLIMKETILYSHGNKRNLLLAYGWQQKKKNLQYDPDQWLINSLEKVLK